MQDPTLLSGEGAGATILLVEDDEAVLKALHDTLRTLGYRVFHAANGGDALVLAEALGEEIDLVISDYVMPGMNGLALYRALRAMQIEVNMLMITGYPMPFSEMVFDDKGHIRWARKPLDRLDLKRLVEQLIGRSRG